MDGLEFLRNAGETRRFHTVPVLREQNVAEHSWHVVMLLWYMYGGQEPGISINLLMAGMTHDAAEFIVGDIPAPAKRNMEQRLELKGSQTFRQAWGDMEQEILQEQSLDWEKFLSVEELRKLKLADAMDGALYCVRERAMGNQLIAGCFANFASYIDELLPPDKLEVPFEPQEKDEADTEWEVRNYIHSQWELADGS